jgi:hypothetical protein
MFVVCALGVAILAAGSAGTARADDDDDTLDTKIFKDVMRGMGLRDGTEGKINYQERSPLVVPPTRDLPPPLTDKAAMENPAWPKDPDIRNRKRVQKPRYTHESEQDMRQLRPDELRGAPGMAGRTGQMPQEPARQDSLRNEQLAPKELGFKGWSFGSIFGRGEESVQFTGEPPRASLTEPPAGLRTPSPRYSYGTKGKLEPERGGKVDIHEFGNNR